MSVMRLRALGAGLALLVLMAAPGVSEARRGRVSFSTDKSFGLGLMLGAPSGLCGKYYFGNSGVPMALDFGVGVFREYHNDQGTHIHADLLWHPVVLTTARSFSLPLYLGIGGRIWEHGDYYDARGHYYYSDTHIGLRAPIGIAFDFNNVPLDVFIEFALIVDVFVNHDHYGYLDFNGAVGVRYYF